MALSPPVKTTAPISTCVRLPPPVIVTHPTAGPSIATLPDPPAQNTMTLERAMEELQQGNISPEMEKMGTL